MKRAAFRVLILLIAVGATLAGFFQIQRTLAGGHPAAGKKIQYYVDPMHPEYRSDKPGIAPDCGMQLTPVYANDVSAAPGMGKDEPAHAPDAVTISPDNQQRIGVTVQLAEKRAGTHTLRLFGRVAADETRVYRMVAGMDGVTRRISGVTTGSVVTRDQWLATFSAPEMRAPLQGYLTSLDVIDRQKQGGAQAPSQIKAADESTRQALDRLLNLGISLAQIEEVKRTRDTPTDLEVKAPAAGIVLARNLSVGQRFDKGTEWYRIADLSRVWIMADVFEQDAAMIRPGQTTLVRLAGGGVAGRAVVSDVPPQFDPGSRTLKVRLEMENRQLVLRPDMFVDVQLPVSLAPAIVVPVDAVLDTGLQKTVYIDLGGGRFEPRRVETGRRLDDGIQIVRGLDAGERIVTSASFLLDSESKMQRIASGRSGQ